MSFRIVEVMIMKTFQVTFTDDAHERAKSAALKAKVTLGDFVRAAVEAYVQLLEGTNSKKGVSQ